MKAHQKKKKRKLPNKKFLCDSESVSCLKVENVSISCGLFYLFLIIQLK